MRNKLERIISFVDLNAKDFRLKNNGIITSNFTDGTALKDNVKNLYYEYEKMMMNFSSWGGVTTEESYEVLYNKAIKEFIASNTIEASYSTTLKKIKSSWLNKQKIKEFNWEKGPTESYRERYFKYLSNLGRTEEEINELKKSTLSILEGFGDPSISKPFFKRGIVVGSVQSGKTANFNGIINSSIDMGYKLIIVLSGIMEDLRSQTQKRVEKEILGPLVGQEYIGVGEVCRMEKLNVEVNSLTSIETDFNQQVARASGQIEKYNILVVKKNVSVLKNILLWLKDYVDKNNPHIKIPLLIIDDEADNASLNNMGHKGKEYATKINQEIRSILGLFDKKTYVGYTATPFANILQYKNEEPTEPYVLTTKTESHKFYMSDDLFPEDFIELLYPSSQYIGIKQFFETKDPKLKKIDPLIAKPIPENDYIDSFPPRFWKDSDTPTSSKERGTRAATKNDFYPKKLPESLEEAIRCFVLAIAVRDFREFDMIDTIYYQPHNTMLIHISRFGDWQNRTKDLIVKYIEYLNIEINKGYSSSIFELFKFTWDYHYSHVIGRLRERHLDQTKYNDEYMSSVDFEVDIKTRLSRAIDNIEVKAINSSIKGENLYYPSKTDKDFESKKYIAIGGNRLSRGFTLEGLTINYFLRATNSADTLMQMGRWFGYRIGYLDCCKLFTVKENIEKFNEASLIIEDLELKFEQLAKLPDKTPRDYTIWIRNNPDVIKLTRVNFLRNLNKMTLDFGSRIQQSSQFSLDKQKIISSINNFKNLAKNLKWDTSKPGYVIHKTNQAGLLSFLELASMDSNTILNLNIIGLKGYLEECKKTNKLTEWIIAIKDTTKGNGSILGNDVLGVGKKIRQTVRTAPTENTSASEMLFEQNIFKVKNAQIISASDFSIGLSEQEKERAIAEFRLEKEQEYLNSKKYNYTKTEAKKNAAKIMVPDFQYRKHMNESIGLLIIYPIEIDQIFTTNDMSSSDSYKEKLRNYSFKNDLNNLEVPLLGYALGFPNIRNVKGENFVTRHIIKSIEEMTIKELKEYIEENNISIDLTTNIDRNSLLKEIIEIEGMSGDEEFDDSLEI